MKTKIISYYCNGSDKTDVYLNTEWNVSAGTMNLISLLKPDRQNKKRVIYRNTVPFSRFPPVKLLNDLLFKLTLRQIIKKASGIIILWIRDPDLYYIHNFTGHHFLVLDCDKAILSENNRYIRYRECFASGWIFTYHINKNYRTTVYKGKTEAEIVKKLLSSYNSGKYE